LNQQGETSATSRLELAFEARHGRTYIASQYADYPFHLCRPHYLDPELPGMASLYLQSCAGGLFENDHLVSRVTVGQDAQVHLTSQASTIVHSSRRGGRAEQAAMIHVKRGALVEYLPDPVILFPHASYATRLDLTLDPSATAIVSDAFIVHDPDGNHGVPDCLMTTISAGRADGTLLAIDRLRVGSEDIRSAIPGGMGSWSCHGTLMVFTGRVPPAELCSALRIVLSAAPGICAGVSTLPNAAGVWTRILAGEAVGLRSAMLQGWQECRQRLTGYVPAARRK
jgi:urease accessory protein